MEKKKIIMLVLIIGAIAIIAFGIISSVMQEMSKISGRKAEEKLLNRELKQVPVTDEHVEEKIEEQIQDEKAVDVDA